jgi:hypothetical protein
MIRILFKHFKLQSVLIQIEYQIDQGKTKNRSYCKPKFLYK